jgi:hypothetical protein
MSPCKQSISCTAADDILSGGGELAVGLPGLVGQMQGEGGSFGVLANENSCAHHVT